MQDAQKIVTEHDFLHDTKITSKAGSTNEKECQFYTKWKRTSVVKNWSAVVILNDVISLKNPKTVSDYAALEVP